MNPCPCGALGDRDPRLLVLRRAAVQRYQGRISGPLLDRIDLQVEVRPLTYAEIAGPPGEASATVAAARRGALAGANSSGDNQIPSTNADLRVSEPCGRLRPWTTEGCALLAARQSTGWA